MIATLGMVYNNLRLILLKFNNKKTMPSNKNEEPQ